MLSTASLAFAQQGRRWLLPSRGKTDGPSLGLTVGLLSLLILGGPLLGRAQPADTTAQAPQEQVYRVETTAGEVLIGTLVSETDTTVVLETQKFGRVTLERVNIESIERLDSNRFRDGTYWFRNPQSTRYFFAPNAIGIPKGEWYYQNTWILFNNVNVGVTDNFSVGAGTVPLFLFGADIFPFWVLPKLSISTPNETLHFAGGAVVGGVFGEGGGGGVGALYGTGTVGSRNHNVTLGVGYGYAEGEIANAPVINVSGMTRISRTVYLISENYFVPAAEDGALVSVGARWAPENFAVDFGLFRPLSVDFDGFIGLPWLGVTIPFG